MSIQNQNQGPDVRPPGRRSLVDSVNEVITHRLKFRRVNEITGVFVLLIIAVLVTAVVWTGRSQRWFKSTVPLRIILPEEGAAGIRRGSEVYFLGTLVGAVSDVIVDARGRMEAAAYIRKDFFLFVRHDSSAVVKKKFGVAGDSYFELTRGEGKPLPEKDASIVCNQQFQSGFESAIEEIRAETLSLLRQASVGLKTWTQLGADLGESRDHLDQLTGRLGKIAEGIQAGEGSVGKLMTDTAFVDEAQVLLSGAIEALAGLKAAITNANLVFENLQEGTARLPEITGALADEAKDLPGLVLQTQTSMHELERVVEAMQRHWFLRKYVSEVEPPLSPAPKPQPRRRRF